MEWKERLQTASWRGVEFFIDSHDFTTGRRSVQHEFPNRDEPFAEDVGRIGRKFSINGHILGDDYFSQRDALIEACEKQGPGVLIHPYLGRRDVQVTEFSVSEDTQKGRFATITFNFIEAGQAAFPRSLEDKTQEITDLSAVADADAIAEFEDSFDVLGFPSQVLDQAISQVDAAINKLEDSLSTIQTVAEKVTEFAFQIRTLKAKINDFIQTPSVLAEQLKSAFDFLSSAGLTSKDGFDAAKVLLTFGDSDPLFVKVDNDSTSRVQANKNTDAVQNYMKRIAITQAAVQGADANFTSVDEAISERQVVNDAVEEQLEVAGDDLFQSLRDVSSKFTDAVPDIDADLPEIVNVTLQDTTPSIVLVHDLFESPDNEQDLIDRNKIREPGFIIGGSTLEVLGSG